MTIDWQIRAGDLLSFFGFALGGLSVIFLMKSDIRALGIKLGFLENIVDESKRRIEDQSAEIVKLGELLAAQGRFDERLISLQRQFDSQQRLIEDLRRGRGLIADGP